MIWIEQRLGEPIPQELYYNGWQTDKDKGGWSPLMLWIFARNGDIPKEFYYKGYQTDKMFEDKTTPLMYWIEQRLGEPIPKELYYSNWQTDRNKWNETPLMFWI